MPETTLEKLQSLKDADFHTLCDDLLPRISPDYHPLVPHGRNDKGDSIVGQPDSYVGDSAETCRIAIQYTVQRKSWWSKAVEDVREAREACPKAKEIVVVLPRDVDREKPSKGDGAKWLEDAKDAAAPAELTVISGRALAQQLDDGCQHIRLVHLGIPFSRLSWHALSASCSNASAGTIDRLASLQRYDSQRYVDREADERIFQLWQRSLLNASGRSTGADREVMIPLVADSGIGKTSVLARFAERASPDAPVLLLLARDISFEDNESLLREVMNQLQGALDSTARSQEEAHIAHTLAGKTPLTVVLDGLDETTNPAGVRKAIDKWLWSRLGRTSVLIVSSRPEFWRNCSDATWANSILKDNEHVKAARPLRHEQDVGALDPMQGIDLPGTFTQHDLANAWVKGGRTEDEAWRLSREVREELKHPFTTRSALDLLAEGVPLDKLDTRTGILDLWLTSRLRAEADGKRRVTESQFRECLVTIACIAEKHAGSFVVVDELDDVPRFDGANPPGPAVERLIAANVLETHPKQPDRIRFTFEAVHDFFLAENALGDIKRDHAAAASHFAAMSFSKAVTRLERIGHQIASQEFREDFVQALAALDGAKAAVVVRAAIDAYSASCRQVVATAVAKLFESHMLSEQALATELLGRMKCDESKQKLSDFWTTNPASKRLLPFVSNAAISHGIVELVPDVFHTWWFTHDNYFVDLRPELMATTELFRTALAEHACQFIPSDEHSDDYRRAITVLGYLCDERAVEAIKIRTQDKFPFFYESLSLIAIGSAAAMDVYAALIDRYVEAKHAGLEKDEARDTWAAITAYSSSVGRLVTKESEELAAKLIQSGDPEQQLVGNRLGLKLGTDALLSLLIRHWKIKGYHTTVRTELGRRIGADKWLAHWNDAPGEDETHALVQIAAELRDPRIEDAIIKSLDIPSLTPYCAQSLAAMGSVRSCPYLRRLLAERCKANDQDDWSMGMLFHSLAILRDPMSVPEMVAYLESDIGTNEYDGAIGLASVGTDEAGNALLQLKNQSDELLVRGFVQFGTRCMIEKAVDVAKRHENGVEWLVSNCRFSVDLLHGWRRHEFRTDIDLEPLLNFVSSTTPTKEVYEHLNSLIRQIDSPLVRKLLKEWRDLRDTDGDLVMDSPKNTRISSIAFGQLVERGDNSVLAQHIKNEVKRHKERGVHDFVVRDLAVFDRYNVQAALRKLLAEYSEEKSVIAVVGLIARVGDETDLPALDALVEHDSDEVANAAFEAKLRLSDPLRLANNW